MKERPEKAIGAHAYKNNQNTLGYVWKEILKRN